MQQSVLNLTSLASPSHLGIVPTVEATAWEDGLVLAWPSVAIIVAMALRQIQLILSALGLASAAALSGASLVVSDSTPSGVSPVVDPDFPGLAFEEASFVEYAANSDGSPNVFSQNLINAIYSRTGGKPLIRLGGTSADYARYIPDQQVAALPVAEVDNYQDIGGTTIGPSYWALTKNFPSAEYIIQVPMATRNISETVAWATAAAEIIGIDRIQAFEPGNEADLYPTASLGPPAYQGVLSNETYVGNFTEYAAAVAEAVKLPSATFFQAFDTAAHLGAQEAEDSSIFDVQTCFELGIDKENYVKTVAHHYYQTSGGTAATLATGLMNHTDIAEHMGLVKPFITYLQQHHPDIPFVYSEVGNSLNRGHSYSYQATLGSALWQVDFQLYGLSIGVSRFNFQQIMHAGYDMWLPVASAGSPPQVFTNFYAQPFVADFVGNSRAAQVVQIEVGDAASNIAAYVAFVRGKPERIAVVNLQYWNASSSAGARGSTAISLHLPSRVKSVTVEHLNSPAGAGGDASNITYAGSQWTYESNGLEVAGVVHDTQTLAVTKGAVWVTVQQSEAILVSLNT